MINTVSVSDQIIAVINELATRFGVAIDWTSENVLPYVKELCSRYIQYEIYTSIAWCALAVLVAAIFGCTIAVFKAKVYKNMDSYEGDMLMAMIITAFCVAFIIAITVCATQVFDIIQASTIPEKTIFEYISSVTR